MIPGVKSLSLIPDDIIAHIGNRSHRVVIVLCKSWRLKGLAKGIKLHYTLAKGTQTVIASTEYGLLVT